MEITWHVEKDFLSEYNSVMARIHNGYKSDYYIVKDLRVREFNNTIDIVKQGFYTTENGTKYTFPDDSEMRRNTIFYDKEFRVAEAPTLDKPTIIEVKNTDCLYAGVELKEQGYNPAILNMASRQNPGGGVANGAGAQEETLFRRTNLFRSLYQFAPYATQYDVERLPKQYPLDRNFGGIYTPNAIYFRDSEGNGYALIDNPQALSFIAVAAINRPELTHNNLIANHLIEPTKNKIRTILRIGLAHQHDALVLGALGCGAFCNPPRHIAKLFHEVLEEPEFANKYRRIVFAILDDHNAHKSHNPEGNFKPFADEFAAKN